ANEIVGTSTAADGTTHAWVRLPGQAMTRLHDADCFGSAHANAIDAAHEIAGACEDSPSVWSATAPHQASWSVIGGFGDLFDIAAGMPVGSLVKSSTTDIAFAWRPTNGFSSIPTPAGTTHAWASSINGSLGL